jgi:hypothetical protein
VEERGGAHEQPERYASPAERESADIAEAGLGDEEAAIVEEYAVGDVHALPRAGELPEHGEVPEEELQQQRDIAQQLHISGREMRH